MNDPTSQIPLTETLQSGDDSGFYQPYAEFAKTLRTWLISYGIGAPALILSNQTAWNAVKTSGHLACIGTLFLTGVGLQILEAFLYKHAMWHLYSAELKIKHKDTSWYKLSEWLSEAYGLELSFDVASIVLFVGATVILFSNLT